MDTTALVRCPACGATARAGAAWCGMCHQRFDEPPQVTASMTTVPLQRAVPQRSAVVQPAYSRWRSTTSTFGPLGRVLWTLAVLLVAGLAVFSRDPFAIGGWCLIAAPLILRSVWAKGRVA